MLWPGGASREPGVPGFDHDGFQKAQEWCSMAWGRRLCKGEKGMESRVSFYSAHRCRCPREHGRRRMELEERAAVNRKMTGAPVDRTCKVSGERRAKQLR